VCVLTVMLDYHSGYIKKSSNGDRKDADSKKSVEGSQGDVFKDYQYFLDARQWYGNTFLYLYKQLIYIIVVMMILVPFTYSLAKKHLIKQPLDPVPFPILAKDEAKYVPLISHLGHGSGNMMVSVAYYMIQKYVTMRESYDASILHKESWADLFQGIYSLSSREVYGNFADYMDFSKNSQSPVLQYGLNTKIIVNKVLVEFDDGEGALNGATATVYAVKKNIVSNKQEKINYKIYIKFDLNIPVLEQDNTQEVNDNITFKVMSYQHI